MPYWMIGEHGTHVCYSEGEVERHKELGWKLLNYGESPDHSKRDEATSEPAAVPVEVKQAAHEPGSSEAEAKAPADILDGTVVAIQPQLASLTKAQLEQLMARETVGRNRKGLLAVLSAEIQAKG